MAKKIAIVAVHGVIPQQRYGFQDQVATALRDQLNDPAAGGKPPAQAPADTARRGAGADGRSDYRSDERGRWRMDIVFPPIAAKPGDVPDPVAAGRPSIVRVHQSESDVQHPVDDVYDVIEAYWSPIDKGKTNALSVLQWLLATIFQPANTTAHYRGWPIKAISDLAYALSLGAIALICLAIALVNATNALDQVHGIALHDPAASSPFLWAPFNEAGALIATWAHRLVDIAHWGNPLDWIVAFFVWMRDGISNAWAHVNDLSSPSALLTLLGAPVLARLVIGAVGAYLGAQALRATGSFWKQRRELAHVRVQMRSRIAFIILLFALSGLALAICACWPLPVTVAGGKTQPGGNLQLGGAAVLLVIAALAFEAFRGILATFLAQFFGDVQIYCTHDENAEFFALRAQILELVEKRIVDTINAKYDRVYVFAHSLGSTISLDALMSIYNLRYENGIAEEDWRRIRGFVTFGTALEKTRYFTNVYGASFSASLEEWRDDYYGALFTADASVLDQPNEMAKGIYWANYWFFWDFISDRIASYRSFMTPSESVSASSAVRALVRDCLKGKDRAAIPKIVAQNRVSYRFPFWPFEILHGDYLASRWFWLDDCESSKWWAPAWLGFRRPDDRDQAIGALELVTKRDAAVPATAFAALPITPPSRPAGSADTAVAATSRFDGVPLGHAAATNLVDVLPPG